MQQKVLLVKGRSGLGNRIQLLICGILYARISNRKLMVDWRDPMYSDDGSNVFQRLFHCPAADHELPLMDDSVFPPIWRGHLDETVSRMALRHQYYDDDVRRHLSIDVTRLDYPERIAVLAGYEDQIEQLRGHFQKYLPELDRLERTRIMAKVLAEDLIVCPEVRRRVNAFKETHFVRRTVGVHLRFSDQRTGLWAVLKQLNLLLNQEPELQIFVATDNEDILKLLQRNYSAVITAPHWYAQHGGAIHTSKSNRQRTERAVEALTDLYLLAECDYLIVDTTSTFSFLASVLSHAPGERILIVRSVDNPGRFGGVKATRLVRRTITWLMAHTRSSTWMLRLLGAVLPIRRL